MNFVKSLFELNLQMFADGAGGAEGGGGAGSEGAGVAPAAVGQGSGNISAAAGQEAGVTSAAAGQEGTTPDAEFDELIKGKFKSQFDARMQSAVSGRLNASRQELKAKNEQLQRYEAAAPVFQILAQKYGLEATDLEGICKAAQEDTSFVEKEAFAKGIDPKDLLQMKQTERENASVRKQLQNYQQAEREAARRQQAQLQVEAWEREAEEVRKTYPAMDLRQELANEQFAGLLRNGFTVKSAYESVHINDILRAGMAYAGQRAGRAVTDSIIAGQARPAENGTSAQGAATTKLNPKNMTDKQIKELWDRASKGERIVL